MQTKTKTKQKNKPTCLCCKKTITGIGIHFYGKESCLACYNEYMNDKLIIKPKN